MWILGGMSESLDVRQAIREANDVFNRFPVRMCLPTIVFGLVSYAVTAHLKPGVHLYWLFILPVLFGTFVLNSFAEVVVSSMCLRAREGTEPSGEQVGEALHYRGFASLIWGLILRYLGWALVLCLMLMVAGALFFGVMALVGELAHNGAGSASGAVEIAHGVAIAGGILIAATIFCRYIFVFPMFAIAGASGPGFLGDCVGRTMRAWKTATLVLLLGTAPAFIPAGVELLVWKHLTAPHLAVQLPGALFTACYTTWFISVKTGLAVQLMSTPLRVSTEPPEPADLVTRIGPPSF